MFCKGGGGCRVLGCAPRSQSQRDTFEKDISFWIYVKIRYENFHCSVIVDNMKEDCGLLEKLRKLQRVVHVLCALCALGFKKDEKVRKLERCITQRSIPV